ncbi:MAG TPA: hypothetical protein VEK34_08865 [Methylocella sp.]|nr:hypothetical protein [Methylocella sp.]
MSPSAVCTGSLVLAATGLFPVSGDCHWLSIEHLAFFGAAPVKQRVVIDRNRITGAGVTSGIDFGLTLAAELLGEERAKRAQLAMEYAPEPPFGCGSPAAAADELVEALHAENAAFQNEWEIVARRAAAALQQKVSP